MSTTTTPMNSVASTPAAIFEAALLLRPEDRAELATKLIASLDSALNDEHNNAGLPVLSDETKAMIVRRIKEIDDGSVALLDGEDVFQRLRMRKSQAAS